MADHMDQVFRVFDVVDVMERPSEAAGRMVVHQVRRYADGTYTYGVGNVDTEDDEWGGLYGGDQLRSAGSHVDAALCEMSGPFAHRDVVMVAATHEDPDLRGRTGVIKGSYEADNDSPEMIGVWFNDIGRFDVVEPRYLIATGDKISRPSPGEQMTSTRVGTDGSVLGTVDYVLVDDVDFYL
jgi:hypothetical protein